MQELTPDQLQEALKYNYRALMKDVCHDCGVNKAKYWLFKKNEFFPKKTRTCRNSCDKCNDVGIVKEIERELTVKEIFTLRCLRK